MVAGWLVDATYNPKTYLRDYAATVLRVNRSDSTPSPSCSWNLGVLSPRFKTTTADLRSSVASARAAGRQTPPHVDGLSSDASRLHPPTCGRLDVAVSNFDRSCDVEA